MQTFDGANIFSTAVTYFNIVSIKDFTLVRVGEMMVDELQKLFGDICRDVFVERWIEPNNIMFSISGCLLQNWFLVFQARVGIAAVSESFFIFNFRLIEDSLVRRVLG